ncbi:MAG: hypothetical protein Q7K55_01825 [Candidatus Levybacteria bacterium]|nr:hypothetical protein [Candidatus Levybacteria bacterium]
MPGTMKETVWRHPDYKQRIGKQYLQLLLEEDPFAWNTEFDYIQHQVRQDTKTQLPDSLIELLKLKDLNWAAINRGLPTLYLGDSKEYSPDSVEEAEVTIEIAHRAIPFARGYNNHNTEPLHLRLAGVVDCGDFGKRIVAAKYDLPTGKLKTVNFSLATGENNNISTAAQIVLSAETNKTNPYLACGLITAAMINETKRTEGSIPHESALVINTVTGVNDRPDSVHVGNALYPSYIARINQPDCPTSIIRVWGTLEDEIVIYLADNNLADENTGRANIVIPKKLKSI